MASITALGSLNRIEKRNLIEEYCRLASLLPVHQRMLFHLYYRDGYSTLEIGQLLMKSRYHVRHRLLKIVDELSLLASQPTSRPQY